MKLTLGRKPAQHGIVIITGSCCIPGMAPFDEQARRVVEQALVETGFEAEVRMMLATTAYMGGVPRDILARLMAAFTESGQIGLPAILLDGVLVSAGIPRLADVKSALLGVTHPQTMEEERNE